MAGRPKLPVPEKDLDGIMAVVRNNAIKQEYLYYLTVPEGMFSLYGTGLKTYRTQAIAIANLRKSIIKHNGFDFNTARRYAKVIVERGLVEVKKIKIDESTGTFCGE